MTTFTFWQNSVSIHQAPLVRALSDLGVNVRVVTTRGLASGRRELGWGLPDYGGAELHIEPSEREIGVLIERSRNDDAHIFSGIDSYAELNSIRPRLIAAGGGPLVAVSEPWDPRGCARKVRNALAPMIRRRAIRDYDMFLACGDLAMRQLRRMVNDPKLVHDFGYFVNPSRLLSAPQTNEVPIITFAGELSPRKDPLMILRALSTLADVPWKLNFVGDGPLRSVLKVEAQKYGLTDRTRFWGAVEHARVREVIAVSDLLILPSRFDGWGAVLNEALVDGVPVIASSMVGAKTLVRGTLQGGVFEVGRWRDLARLISLELDAVSDQSRKQNLQAWANECITAEVAARYLIRLLATNSTETAVAPWKYRTDSKGMGQP